MSSGRLCRDELPPFDFPAVAAGGGVEGGLETLEGVLGLHL
jgi:hypothetical protein